MKWLSVGFVTCLAMGANAQEPLNTFEQTIWQTYGKLQTESNFELELTGYESSFGITRKFSSYLYFSTATDPRSGQATGAKVELDDYDTSNNKPVLVHRYVGDGKTLWTYDLVNARYMTSFYSYYGKTPNADYPGSDAPRMLAQLYKVVGGPASYLVRMMREINPGSTLLASRYDTWAPGEAPGQPLTAPPTQDPLVPVRTYATLPTEQWVLYGPYSSRPDRAVAFQIDDKNGNPSDPDWRLTSVYFAEKTSTKTSDMTLQVVDPILIQPNYAFQPYPQSSIQGWLPVSSPQPYSG